MKEIKASIKPFKLEAVIDALREIKGLPALTISPAHGLSVEQVTFDQVVETKLEMMIPDELVARPLRKRFKRPQRRAIRAMDVSL